MSGVDIPIQRAARLWPSQRKSSARDRAASVSATRRCIISATGRISLIPPAVCPAVSRVSCGRPTWCVASISAPQAIGVAARLLVRTTERSSRRHFAGIMMIPVVSVVRGRGDIEPLAQLVIQAADAAGLLAEDRRAATSSWRCPGINV
jgi:hypothetical protein